MSNDYESLFRQNLHLLASKKPKYQHRFQHSDHQDAEKAFQTAAENTQILERRLYAILMSEG